MMQHKFWDKQIPTALGLAFIIIGLATTTFLTNKQTILQSNAANNNQPQEVRISNITDHSLTISYKTSDRVSGYINYGINASLGETAFDETDVSQKLQDHMIHSITLKNLTPLTKYYFSIISGGDTYLNNSQNFDTTTAAPVNTLSSLNDIVGKIILPDANIPSEAIVYVTTDNSQVLSSLVANDGTYRINLNHMLSFDLSNLYGLTAKSVIQILALGDGLIAKATLYYSQINNIPIITLSNSYDFRTSLEKNASPSASLGSFPILSSASSLKNKGLQILTPLNNQVFSNQKPIIKGNSMPNQNIQITIHSKEQIQTVVGTDSNGNWSYQPSTPLSTGTHTITITAKDASGILRTITQSFIVYAADASSSATNITNTPTPTIKLISRNLTQQPLPQSGNTSIITAGITALLITVVGGIIFLLSRKGI